MKKLVFLSLSFILICFLACTHKSASLLRVAPKDTLNTTIHTSTGTTVVQDSNVVDTSVCFERDILPIFTGYCAMAGCHNATYAKSGYIFVSYATIVAKGLVKGNSAASAVYTACSGGKMPKSPTPKLDSTRLSLIRRWINMGATDDTDCVINCDTASFTYSKAIAPILSKYCYSCHATASAANVGGGFILDNYSAVVTQAHNGNLMGGLNHQTGYNAMPLSGNKLSDCMITQVSKWIAAGAPNN